MNTYRIVYWLGSMTTERYVKANTGEEAKKKFLEWQGRDVNIVSIEKLETV